MRHLRIAADNNNNAPLARNHRLRLPVPGIRKRKKRTELSLVHNRPIIKPAQGELTAELTLVVSNIQSDKGRIMLAVYDSRETFNGQILHAENVQARQGEVTFRYPNLPIGDYAVMAFQDMSGNGKLDTDLLGRPTEPWGASMCNKPLFRAPTWSDACFKLPEDGLSFTVKLQQ